MATTKKRAPRKATKAKRSIVVIGKKRKRRSSSVGATRHRRKRRISGTGMIPNMSNLKQIAATAMGVGIGVGVSKFILEPMSAKVAEKYPFINKLIAAGEILLGGIFMLKAKSPMGKGVGLGILACGVQNGIEQTHIFQKLGINGPSDEYQTIRVPISGELDNMISGILDDNRRNVRTEWISGLDNTNVISGNEETNDTYWVSETELDNVFTFPEAKF